MLTAIKVSVITTVYNECETIAGLLDSLALQTRPPDEIVICDGGSQDGTVERINTYRAQHADRLPNLQLIVAPGANISRGRNLAIAAATNELIAVTDAGVRLTPQWLSQLVAPWQLADLAEPPLAVAGFFLPDLQGTSGYERAFLVAMAATVLPLVTEIDPAKFLPSSRSVAFAKAAWAKAGGYPEWLDYCEDLIFDFKINAQRPATQSAFVWAPSAAVYFRPRATLRAFWTQYYRYARGDGKADLWRKRQLVRYLTYLVVLPALVGHAGWGCFARWLGWLGLAIGVIVYCGRPWQRLGALAGGLTWRQQLGAYLWVPLIRLVGDVAKLVGYPVGCWWRYQRRGDERLNWREHKPGV